MSKKLTLLLLLLLLHGAATQSSPLILGFNMSNQDQMDRVWPILTNKEAIAIDHDWAGSPGMLYKTLQNQSIEVWAKPLPSRKVAILVLNAGDTNLTFTLSGARARVVCP